MIYYFEIKKKNFKGGIAFISEFALKCVKCEKWIKSTYLKFDSCNKYKEEYLNIMKYIIKCNILLYLAEIFADQVAKQTS